MLAALLAAISIFVVPVTAANAATTVDCGYADPDSGEYAATLCWLDMSDYDAALAGAIAGQSMIVALPGGYTLAFTARSTGGVMAATAVPTWSQAWLGNSTNPDLTAAKNYKEIPGRPALYQMNEGTDSTVTLSDISVVDALGATVTGFALVGADAETTDLDEILTWTSDKPVTQLDGLGNSCGGSLSGVGTTTVTCVGSDYEFKDGTAIVAAEAPTTFSQSMLNEVRGGGKEAIAFGVLVARLTLNKTVDGRALPTDSFDLSIRSAEGTTLASATTGPSGTATTGGTTVLTGPTAPAFELSETVTPGTSTDLANYKSTWVCVNSATGSDTPLPSEAGTTQTVSPAPGDDITCELTNTANLGTLTLEKVVNNSNGGTLVPADWTLTAQNGATAVLDERPTLSTTATSAQTSTVPVSPAVAYTLSETGTSTDYTGGTWTCTAGGTLTGGDVTVAPGAVVVCSIINTFVPAPAITIVKSATPTDVASFVAGQVIHYSFVVTNTGNVTLTDVTVDETTFSGAGPDPVVSCPVGAASLAPGAAVTCTASYTLTQGDVDNGELTNTAVSTGTPPGTMTPPVSPPSTVEIPSLPAPAISLVKSADATVMTAAGQTVNYSFLVTNTGNVTLTDVDVEEIAFSGSGALSAIVCPAGAASLLPGASTTCQASYVTTQADIDSGVLANTAIATGTPPGTPPPVSPPSSVEIPSAGVGSLGLEKAATAVDVNGNGVIDAGDRIEWKIIVTNTGAIRVDDIVVSDPIAGAVACPAATLGVAETMTCTVPSHTVTSQDIQLGYVYNIATAAGTPPGGEPVIPPSSETSTNVYPTPPTKLAFTGSDIGAPLFAGGLLVAFGAVLLPVARIRRKKRE